MYNLLLVEDDFIVRKYIRELLKWDQLGIVCLYEAENGEEALEIMANNVIQLVITDINMPKMNGVELIKKMPKQNIKTVVLSCHDEYEFVREAMKNGAMDYILKHDLNGTMLKEIIQKMIQIYEESKSQNQGLNRNRTKDLVLDLQNKVITNLYDVQCNYPSYVDFFSEERGYFVVLLKIDHEKHYKNKISGYIQKMFSVISRELSRLKEVKDNVIEDVLVTPLGYNEVVIFIGVTKDQVFENRTTLFNQVEKVIHQCENAIECTISAGISLVCHSIKAITEALHNVREIVKGGMLQNSGKIYLEKHTKKNNDVKITFDDEKKLYKNLLNGNIEYVIGYFEDFFNKLALYPVHHNNMKVIFINVIHVIIKICERLQINHIEVFGISDPYSIAGEVTNIREFKHMIKDAVYKTHTLNMNSNTKNRKEILLAKEYIEENYGREINLEDVAKHVALSSNYMSILFKKLEGVSFSEYLTNKRMEVAKNLLKHSDMRIFDIAFKTGFNSEQYFTRVFKKQTGLTPLKYRKNKVKT